MLIPTFEYCSLHYLNQWLNYDRSFCEALSGYDNAAKLSTLKKAAGFYRVARNLPTEKKGVERYQPVLNILDSVCPEQFKHDRDKEVVEEIKKIERQISKKYGGRNVLSLTTKFLWLKVKHNILIYDSQARNAVCSINGDLYDFYVKWEISFEENQEEIKKACTQLPALYRYAANQEVGTEHYINKISSQDWFQKRVFDIFLWHKGNNS